MKYFFSELVEYLPQRYEVSTQQIGYSKREGEKAFKTH